MSKNSKQTSPHVASVTGKALGSSSSSAVQRSLAGSALRQAGSSAQTGAQTESRASRALDNGGADKNLDRQEVVHVMYSYEDRIRAVELYIKLGKRVRPTIRQLGYTDAAEMQRKSQLAGEIARAIKARRLTQEDAAALLGIDQSKVSRITRGQFRGVSEAKLLELVARLGHDVKIVVGAVRRRAGKIELQFA